MLPFELVDAVDLMPMDPLDECRPPAAVAAHLSPVRRVARERLLSLPAIEYRLLGGLALSGWSLRWALVEVEALEQGVGPRSGTLNRACRFLAEAGLWETTTVRINRRRTALVRLTPYGRDVLALAGVKAVESEWERIERLHRGNTARQRQHTGALCAFAYHARRCGYDTEVCPQGRGATEPDIALVETDGLQIHVEVQGRGGEPWRRARKWQNLAYHYGWFAICAHTPDQARRYAREARNVGVRQGWITDLHTLQHRRPSTLWTHSWQSPYGGLHPVTL